jgi:hypothetical protein
MATVIDDIVKVSISRESSAIQRAGFGTPLLMSTHTRFAERLKIYTGSTILTDMVADGFLTSDVAYLMAAIALQQRPRLSRLAIGRGTAAVPQVVSIDVAATSDQTYRVVVNGVNHDFPAVGQTATQIRDGLIAAINGGTQPVTAAISDADTFTLTADVAGVPFTYSAVGTVTGDSALVDTLTTPNNGPTDDLDATEAENDEDWYGFAVGDVRTDALMKILFDWAEARIRLYGATNDSAAVKAGTAGNIAELLQDASYTNGFYLWHDPATEDYGDVAWLARGLAFDLDARRGQGTWALKSLAGVATDKLSGGERTTIHGYKANTYERRAGRAITFEGWTPNGEYIDLTTTIHWLDSRLTEDVFAALAGVSTKVGYSQEGLDLMEAATRRRLSIAQSNGHILPGWTVSIPTLDEIEDADRTARLLRNLEFNAEAEGAIHRVEIQGRIAV